MRCDAPEGQVWWEGSAGSGLVACRQAANLRPRAQPASPQRRLTACEGPVPERGGEEEGARSVPRGRQAAIAGTGTGGVPCVAGGWAARDAG